MKAKKHKKPRFRNSILFFCYLAGVFDRWFKRNKGEVEDASFIARRIAAFTDYTAMTMKTEQYRSEAQIIMSNLDDANSPNGKSMGQKRARKLLEESRAKLITLDGSIRKEAVKAREMLLPYADKLKTQTITYAHGFSKKPLAEAILTALYSVEQNSAYVIYQNTKLLLMTRFRAGYTHFRLTVNIQGGALASPCKEVAL